MVRVDLDALLRGHVEGDECCEIDNQGPIPVAMARDLANDSFLRVVFHQAGDIRAVHHLGRTINQQLRTALVFRDRTCVVPGCGTSFGLEIDHIVPFAEGGPTTLDNLALLCHHHHFLKTYEGWVLANEGTGPNGHTPVAIRTPTPLRAGTGPRHGHRRGQKSPETGQTERVSERHPGWSCARGRNARPLAPSGRSVFLGLGSRGSNDQTPDPEWFLLDSVSARGRTTGTCRGRVRLGQIPRFAFGDMRSPPGCGSSPSGPEGAFSDSWYRTDTDFQVLKPEPVPSP